MNTGDHQKESGQVLILIAVAFIVLLGFTALAIDGGMIYSDRRQAQNAADAAALAGALQKAEGQLDTTAIAKAEEVLAVNHYDPAQASIVVSTGSDSDGSYFQVQVDLSSITKMFFAHLFGFNEVENKVNAVAKTRGSFGGPEGAAIIAMGDCTIPVKDGGVKHLITLNGGGAEDKGGGLVVLNGDIFLNSPGPDVCPIELTSAPKSIGVLAVNGNIISVGSYDYPWEPMIDPSPITQHDANGGLRIGDPLEGLDEPVCNSNGSVDSPNVYNPGNYGEGYSLDFPTDGDITLKPGIYCIYGDSKNPKDISMASGSSISGDGVVLYLANLGAKFSGQALVHLTAPTDTNCEGTAGDPSNICDYNGMVIFSARGNTAEIEFSGNGHTEVWGTVYALDGSVRADGGGSEQDEWVVRGQVITKNLVGNGSGTFSVLYDDEWIYHGKPKIALTK